MVAVSKAPGLYGTVTKEGCNDARQNGFATGLQKGQLKDEPFFYIRFTRIYTWCDLGYPFKQDCEQ